MLPQRRKRKRFFLVQHKKATRLYTTTLKSVDTFYLFLYLRSQCPHGGC